MAQYYRLRKTEEIPEAGRIYYQAMYCPDPPRRVHRGKLKHLYEEPVDVDAEYTGSLRKEVDNVVGVGDIFAKDDGKLLLKTSAEWTELLNGL